MYVHLDCAWDISQLSRNARGGFDFINFELDPAEGLYTVFFREYSDDSDALLIEDFQLTDEVSLEHGLSLAVYTPTDESAFHRFNYYEITRPNRLGLVALYSEKYHDLLLSCME